MQLFPLPANTERRWIFYRLLFYLAEFLAWLPRKVWLTECLINTDFWKVIGKKDWGTPTEKLGGPLKYRDWDHFEWECNHCTGTHLYELYCRLDYIPLFTLLAPQISRSPPPMAYIPVVIPYPGTPGAPFFDGKNITPSLTDLCRLSSFKIGKNLPSPVVLWVFHRKFHQNRDLCTFIAHKREE